VLEVVLALSVSETVRKPRRSSGAFLLTRSGDRCAEFRCVLAVVAPGKIARGVPSEVAVSIKRVAGQHGNHLANTRLNHTRLKID
jgi:hypothetical protein